MRGRIRKLISILLALALMCANLSAIAEAVLALPKALKIIDTEAFYGDTAIDKVVVPEGTTEIRARAFANSTLSEINLPDSLTFIDDTAFEGLSDIIVTSSEGSYAYNWAVEKGYINTSSLRVSVTCSATEAVPEESVTWMAEGVNGVAPYKYRFQLFCDGARIATRAYTTDNTYTYTFSKAGSYYVIVQLKDDNGEIVETQSAAVSVSLEALKVSQITCDLDSIQTTETATWTATATGGEQPYQYCFTLKKDSETIDASEFSDSNSYAHTFEDAGAYMLEAAVKDALGTISALYELPVSVSLKLVEITAITADAKSAVTESTITWTVSAFAGKAPYTYDYEVMLNGASVASEIGSSENIYTYHTETAGDCVLNVTVHDAAGNAAKKEAASIPIATKTLTIDSITAESDWVKAGDEIHWMVSASGGVKPLRYAFDVFVNGEEEDGRAFKTDAAFNYEPRDAGDYTVKARVRDADNTTVELTGGLVHVYNPITIKSVAAAPTSVLTGEAVTWTVDIDGGKGKLRYDYQVYCGDTLEYVTTSAENTLLYAPMHSGIYTVKLRVTDENGDFSELSSNEVSVALHDSSPVEDFTFKTLNGTYCEITGYVGSDTALVLPEADSEGHIVQNIASNAFKNKTELRSVVIPDCVETMGSNVFYGCSNLLTVIGGAKLTNIGSNAFYNCASLKNYLFEELTETIGDYAFYGCYSLQHFEGWNGIKTIGRSAFSGLSGLRSVSLPEGLTTLNYNAFSGCTALESIHLPDSITTMYDSVFSGCSKLSSVNYPLNWTTKAYSNRDYSPFYNCPKLTSIVVPEGVTSIPANAFYGMTSLKNIELPSTLTTIGNNAFYHCAGMASIVLPEGLTTIGGSAFVGCSGLTSIIIPQGITEVKRYTFSDCTGLRSVSLPEGLTTLNYNAFSGCTALESIHLPDSITTMYDSVFSGCSKLSSVNYPLNWTTKAYSNRDYSPFYNCPKLTSIVVPEGVTSIPANAFYGMTSLKNIELPSTLTTIGNNAFYYCSGMTAIYIGQNVTGIGSNAFTNHHADLVIYGESGSYAEIYANENNITFSTEPFAVTYGTIRGKVLDTDGNAVSGVSIALSRYGTGNIEFQTFTDTDGAWVINNVPAGYQYQVSYMLDGYTFTVDNRVCTATESGFDVGTVIATAVNAAALNTLSLSISTWTGSSEDAQRYFTISSVGGWYVESKPDWATVYADEAVSGSTSRRVLMAPKSVSSTTSDAVLILENNDKLTSRQGDIIISNGVSSAIVSITQLPESYEGMAVQFTYPNAETISVNESTELTISLEAINFKYGELSIIAPDSQETTTITFTDANFRYPYTFRETGEYTVFATIYGNDRFLDAGDGISRPSVQTQKYTVIVARSTSESVSVKTSAKGVQLIKDYETFRATPYVDGNTNQYDADGHRLYHWSIGYGEQLPDLYSEENPPQITITEEEASVSLLKKLAKREAMVDGYLSKWGVTLSTTQYDAVMSFNWNFWPGTVFTDTSNFESFQRLIKKYANGGSAENWEVYRTFVLYHHFNDKDNVGLFKRRMTEANLFVTGDYSTREWDYVELGADSWFMVPDADGVVRRGLSVPSDWRKNQVVQGLTIAVTSYSYNKSGGSESISVAGSTSWKAHSDSNWITIEDSATGYGISSLAYKVDANTTGNRRVGHVTVIDLLKNRSVTLTISQEGTTETSLSVILKPVNIRSGAEVKLGNLFGFTAVGTGGEGTYTYSFTVQKMNDAGVYKDYAWNSKYASFPQNDTIALEADTQGFFRICATATDGNGNIAQVYDTFSVSGTDPIVYDGAFADGNYYDKDDMPTVRWKKHTSAFYYRVKIVELAQVGTSSVHYVIPENGRPSDEGLMVMTNSIDLGQYTFKNSQTYRMWVGAYSIHGIRIAQSEFIFSTNPLENVNVSLASGGTLITENDLVPRTDDLTVSWTALIPNSAWNRSVAYYRANIRDDNTMTWVQSVKSNCAHMPASQTSFTVPVEELYRGHSYTMWLAAFTKEGARIGQTCVAFTVDGSIIWDDPVTTVTTTLNADKANATARSYVNECINARIWADREWNRNLNVGKAAVFLFEGAGANSSSNQRQYALCVVVKNDESGVPVIVYQNEYCSTIPDLTKRSVSSLSYVSTIKDGTYNIRSYNWKHGKSLWITPDATVRFNDSSLVNGEVSSSGDLLIHQRWWNDNTLSPVNGSVNSAGCILIGQKDNRKSLDSFLKAVNGGTLDSWPQGVDKGCVIIDRSLARQYLIDNYGEEGAKKISPNAFK